MLSADALDALDRIPSGDALRLPLFPKDTGIRRTAKLLAGDEAGAGHMTVGDALFRWARVEPEALAEADMTMLRRMSETVAAVGRIPRRFGLNTEVARSAAGLIGTSLGDLNLTDSNPVLATARSYLIQRLIVHLFDAQGCEAKMCGAEADPTSLVLNGLQAVIHDPAIGPPTKIDRLTFVTEDMLHHVGGLAGNPLVFALMGMDSGTMGALLPDNGVFGTLLDDSLTICLYANAAAQAGRLLLRRDTGALVNLASLASGSVAGHVGHIAGKAAAVALLGVTGSWMVVLAPVVTGFAGRALARNLARRARYGLFCRREVAVLRDAVSLHSAASRDALQANVDTADVQGTHFRQMHASTTGPVRDVMADWLIRLGELQDFRKLNVDRFHRAISDPGIFDPHGGDPVAAAQESLLACARVGLHPANVAATSGGIVAASQNLHRKLTLAIV